jgi:long-subunit acyl-CoA synthetase (AMP-forming)
MCSSAWTPGPEDLGHSVYTSGTTENLKGAMHYGGYSYRAWLHNS